MHLHTQIELLGGPEDGRQFVLPASTNDGPLSPLPVPSPRNDSDFDALDTDSQAEFGTHTAWYERHHQRGRQHWVYRYVTSHPSEPDGSPSSHTDSAAPISDVHS